MTRKRQSSASKAGPNCHVLFWLTMENQLLCNVDDACMFSSILCWVVRSGCTAYIQRFSTKISGVGSLGGCDQLSQLGKNYARRYWSGFNAFWVLDDFYDSLHQWTLAILTFGKPLGFPSWSKCLGRRMYPSFDEWVYNVAEQVSD